MNKKKVIEFLSRMDHLFSTHMYEKKIIFSEGDQEDEDSDLLAEIYTDHAYQFLKITIYPSFFKKTPKEQAEALIHELSHTVLADSKLCAHDLSDGVFITKKRINEINETATSKLEQIIFHLCEDNSFYKQTIQNYVNQGRTPRKTKGRLQKKRSKVNAK